MVIPLQPHFDEGPEDDLEAHRELERGRGLPREDPSPVQEVLRENEEDFRLVREHHHPLPAQRTPDRTPSPYRLALYNSYLIYNLYNDIPSKSSEIAGSEAGAPGQGERVMHFEMFGASVLVGLMSGWLAGIAMKGGGYGLLWDIIFGLSGSVVGSWIFQTLGAPEAGWGGTGIAAFVGAVLMITLQRKIWPAQVAHA